MIHFLKDNLILGAWLENLLGWITLTLGYLLQDTPRQAWAAIGLPPVVHKFGESGVLYVFQEIAFQSLKGQLQTEFNKKVW